jgi:D-3-phosphoglycerate dehydrogenase
MKNCLVVDKMHESILQDLKSIGFTADYRPDIRREEIKEIITDYEGLIIRSKTDVDLDLIANAQNLKFIARAGAGVDQIDTEALEQNGITLLNAPEGNRDALGEHAVGLLLSLLNKIHIADDEIRHWKWLREKNRGVELSGKTIGILGYGHMGSAFARKLGGFDCTVIAYDKYRKHADDAFAGLVDEHEFFQQTDILSIHIPYNHENEYLIDRTFLNSFQKQIYLMNTARGGVLKLNDLVEEMKSGKIIGAALDVLQNEKLDTLTDHEKESFEYLIRSERTVMTPHVGGWSYESYRKINQVLCEKIAALYA